MTPADARALPPPDVARRPAERAGRADPTREQLDDLVRLVARPGARGDVPAVAGDATAPPWSPETRRRLLASLRGSRPTAPARGSADGC